MMRVPMLAALMLAACGPESATTLDESTTTTGAAASTAETAPITTGDDLTCPDRGFTDACCCFEENRDDELVGFFGTRSVCGAPPLCAPIELDCQEYPPCPDDKLTTSDAVDLDCVLNALAQGDPGRVEWQVNFASGVEVMQYDLVGGATMFRQHIIYCDLSAWTEPVVQLSLPPASYFTACLAEPEVLARFICLRDAPFAPPLATCLDGEHYGGVIC